LCNFASSFQQCFINFLARFILISQFSRVSLEISCANEDNVKFRWELSDFDFDIRRFGSRVLVDRALFFFSLAVVIVSARVCFRDLDVPVAVVPIIITE